MATDYKTRMKTAVEDGEIPLSEIPTIDLYMDQIITLMDERLTKTMINNYSKEGLIKPIKGKKYSREHIVQMLLIYAMKNTLSIQEIKQVMEGLYRKENFGGDQLLLAYETYLSQKPQLREQSSHIAESLFPEEEGNGEGGEKNTQRLVSLLSIITLSNYLKTIAQELIKEMYPKK